MSTVNLAGMLPGAAGASYVLKPSGWRTDSTNLLLLPPKPVSGRLTSNADGSGSLAVAGLLATDGSGPVPAGWTWSIGLSGIAGVPELDFSFFLPAGPYSFTATQASPAVFTAAGSVLASGSTLTNGMQVVLSGGSLPGGFTAGIYYLVSASGTTFSLAATPGGSPIASNSAGSGTLTVTQADISGLAQVQPSTPMAAFLQGSYPGGTTDFLRADGQWTVPPGTGAQLGGDLSSSPAVVAKIQGIPITTPPDTGSKYLRDDGAWDAAGFGVIVGALPTGQTATDTPNLQAMITLLENAGGNRTMQLCDGTYQVDSNALVIRNCSDFRVRGTCTFIEQAPNRTGLPNNTTGDLLVIADCTDFGVEGITFDGQRDTVAPMTPLTASASSGQASVTVASGQGSRYLAGQFLYLFGGLGTAEQNQSQGFSVGAGTPLVIQSISPGGGSGGGDKITFTSNLSNSYTQISSTPFSDGFGPYAYAGAYLTSYQVGHNNSVAGRTLSGEDQQCGLHLISCQRFDVSGCTARNLWESPFKLGTGEAATSATDGCSDGIVSGCIAYHAYDQGVSVWLSDHITVSGNICNAAGWAGISLTASDYSIVTGNQVQNSVYRVPGDAASGSGIVTEGGVFNKITQNIISSPFSYGVQTVGSPLSWGLGGTLPTTSTFLSAGTAGGTSVQISATSSLQQGGRYSILDGYRSEAVTVQAIVDSTHVKFAENLSFSHNSGVTIGVRVSQATLVEDNTITGCGLPGVLLTMSARGLILNNSISGCAGQGISADYNVGFRPATVYPLGDGARIEGNVITNGAGAGIKCDGPTRMQVRSNTISSPNGFGGGIEMHGATDSDVSANRVTDIVGSYGVVIENGGQSGTPSARLLVQGNIIERCGDLPGLSVQTGDSLTITGNEVRSCAGTAGMYLQGVTRSEISGNIANSNQNAGIVLDDNGSVHSLYNRVTGNTCRDDGTGEEISFGGNAWTQQHGIREIGSSNFNLLTGNTCDTNAVDQLTTTGASSYAWANIISGAVAAGTAPGGTGGLSLQAATPEAGFALQNGTPNIVTWTAPNDGNMHQVLIFGGLSVGGTAETGGQVSLSLPLPNGATVVSALFAAGQGAFTAINNAGGGILGPGATIRVFQSTALTGGAATVWASIWGQ